MNSLSGKLVIDRTCFRIDDPATSSACREPPKPTDRISDGGTFVIPDHDQRKPLATLVAKG